MSRSLSRFGIFARGASGANATQRDARASEAGFILPLTILLISALSALALAFQALARADRQMLGWDRAAFQSQWGTEQGRTPLGQGYALVRSGTSDGGVLTLEWVFDPATAAHDAWDPLGDGVEGAGTSATDDPASGAILGAAPGATPGATLGPWRAVDWIARLSEAGVNPEAGVPSGAGVHSVQLDDGEVASFGAGTLSGTGVRILTRPGVPGAPWVVLAPEAVLISGSGSFFALVLADGPVAIDSAVAWIGGGRVLAVQTTGGMAPVSFTIDPQGVQAALQTLQEVTGVAALIPQGGAHLGRWVP